MPPKISVMLPTYNHQQFIAETLDSVLAQGYDDLEIVIGDDASHDDTPEILREYAKRYPGVFKLLLHPKNLGVATNCNAILAECTGEYVSLFAGDDLMLPGKFAAQAEYMETHPECVLCYHDLQIFDSATGIVIGRYNRGPRSFPPREGRVEHLVKHGTFTGGCSIMLRRSACPPHGFSAQIPLASDWLFWIETAANGTIGYIDQVLGCYRRHPGSITARRVLTADPLLTLALIDERLPALRSHTRAYRRRYFLRSAAKGYLQRQNRLATRYLTEFLRSLLGLPTAHHAG